MPAAHHTVPHDVDNDHNQHDHDHHHVDDHDHQHDHDDPVCTERRYVRSGQPGSVLLPGMHQLPSTRSARLLLSAIHAEPPRLG
jgi:hypothetical protein